MREPLGVVAAFAPWNAPIILSARAVAAPLAAGNTVVLKPSEDAPIAAGLFIADVLREAGLPAGVLNVVTNAPEDAAEVAEALITDPRVRAVNFTGSTEVGRIVGTLAAQHLKPAVLELGGKNALLVLDDADLDHAVDAATFGAFHNAGQICMSTDRILVHRSVAEEFTAKLAAKVASLPHGDPADPGTVHRPGDQPARRRTCGRTGRRCGRSGRACSCRWDGRDRARRGDPGDARSSARRSSARPSSSCRSRTTTKPWRSPTTPSTASPRAS